jgi:hypothetical protein
MGTEEEIREHEPQCFDNYDKKSCFTCVHKRTKTNNGTWYYECEKGIEIPEGKLFEFCGSYERNAAQNQLKDIFGDLFGFDFWKK